MRPADHLLLSRRQLLLGGSAAALLLAAGCGSDEADDATTTTVGGAEADAYPTTIEHLYGSTTIDAPPQRVFAMGLTDIDPILALGVTPVGFIDWYGEYPLADIQGGLWPWAQDLLEGEAPTVLPRNDDKFNFEAIAALRPDLIITQYSGMTEQEYELATQIAPCVAQSKDFPLYQTPWDVTTRIIGQALGKPDRAEELIAGVEGVFEAARAEHPEFAGRTAMLVDNFEGVLYARGPQEPHGKVLAELGFGYPAEVEALIPDDDVLAELSLEQIGLLDSADVVIVGDTDGTLGDEPLYQALEIVAQGRVVPGMEPIEGALYWASVASLPFAVERLVPMLAAAVDADPATPVPTP
jgi:iron complex transport system substrate-binding protein